MGDCWDDRSKWEIYNEKIDKHAHSVQNSKVIRTCLARGKILENVGLIWFGWVLWHINHCRFFNSKFRFCIYIKYIWFVELVLWQINQCRLFYAKSSLYVYITYIFLVEFYGISTIGGYLMPNPLYTYIWNIYDLDWLGFMAYQTLQVI